MKQTQTRRVVLLCTLFLLAFSVVGVVFGAGCELALEQQWKDADTEQVFEAKCLICLAEIKAATDYYTFAVDGCSDGYCVTGLGTYTATAYEDSPTHDISHINWYTECRTTAVGAVSKPTLTPIKIIQLFISLLLFGLACYHAYSAYKILARIRRRQRLIESLDAINDLVEQQNQE